MKQVSTSRGRAGLRKRIQRTKLEVRITRCITSDKMTGRQIAQKARRHYLPLNSAASPRRKEAMNRRTAGKST